MNESNTPGAPAAGTAAPEQQKQPLGLDHQAAPGGEVPSALTVDAQSANAPSAERSAKDYAIEHAGYLAAAAKDYLDAVNAEFTAQMDHEEQDSPDTESALDAAIEETGEANRKLRSAIYEFEKRRDRALAEPSASGADHDGATTVNGEATPARGAAECTEPSSSLGTPGAAPLPAAPSDEEIIAALQAAGVEFQWMAHATTRREICTTSGSQRTEKLIAGIRSILASAVSPAGGTLISSGGENAPGDKGDAT